MSVRRLAPPEHAAEGLRLHGGESGLGASSRSRNIRQAARLGGDPAAVARAGAGRRLAAEAGDRARRRHARHGAYPRARGRDLLHDVQSGAGRQIPRAGLRHDAVQCCAARTISRTSASKRIGDQIARHRRRQVLLGRSRVPRRLRERADGADQQRLLRGPDARRASSKMLDELRRPAKPAEARPADRPAVRRAPVGGADRRSKPTQRPTRSAVRHERRCSPTRTASSRISTAARLGPRRRARARRLGRHQGDPRQGPRRDRQRDEGVGPARPRRRRLPDRPEMVVHAQAGRTSGRTISWSMPTSPSPAPARTARSCGTIRICWSKAA